MPRDLQPGDQVMAYHYHAVVIWQGSSGHVLIRLENGKNLLCREYEVYRVANFPEEGIPL